MKAIIKNVYTFLFFLIFIFTGFISEKILCQTRNLDNEILVYIMTDSMEFSKGYSEVVDLSQLKINSKSLELTLGKFDFDKIYVAFPDFNPNKEIFNEFEEEIKLPMLNRIFIFKLKDQTKVEEVISLLKKENSVLFAEKNMNAKLFDDPDYNKQWYLNNTGQSGGLVDADIDADLAWNIFTGSSSIKIGIIDSGVKTDHEDLLGKTSGDLPDGEYHGTHVAGICGANSNNSKGGRGVDWNAQIYSQRIFDASGYIGDVNTANKIINAVNNGTHIMNHSWGGPDFSSTVRIAFSYAYKMNRVSTVAMGNDYLYGNPTSYPAAFGQGILAVGSTTDNDVRSNFSQTGNHIDVTAPGGINPFNSTNLHDIWSSWGPSTNSYRYVAGTSMATPVVTGIASLLKGYNPDLYNDDIEQIIRISADDKGPTGWDQEYGTGRVNAYNALNLLRAPYQLSQISTYGGSDVAHTGAYTTIIYGANGLADGVYIVERHEIRKNVSFAPRINVNVWGRGVGTSGWSIASPNFSMGFCDVVPGSVTSTGATLRTYIYKVWSVSGSYLGYYPSTANNVTLNYTILGIPSLLSATMSGPSYLSNGQTGTFTVTASGGTPPYSYAWSYFVYCNGPIDNPNGGGIIEPNSVPCGYWFNISNTTNTVTRRSDGRSFQMKCIVTDAAGSKVTVTKDVEGGLSKLNDKDLTNNLISEMKTELLDNYPNPFNPSTIIKYSLKDDGKVSLKIFNSLGEEVRTLVNEIKPAGNYEVEFNASELPSGIYIYSIQAGEYISSKKMILLK